MQITVVFNQCFFLIKFQSAKYLQVYFTGWSSLSESQKWSSISWWFQCYGIFTRRPIFVSRWTLLVIQYFEVVKLIVHILNACKYCKFFCMLSSLFNFLFEYELIWYGRIYLQSMNLIKFKTFWVVLIYLFIFW